MILKEAVSDTKGIELNGIAIAFITFAVVFIIIRRVKGKEAAFDEFRSAVIAALATSIVCCLFLLLNLCLLTPRRLILEAESKIASHTNLLSENLSLKENVQSLVEALHESRNLVAAYQLDNSLLNRKVNEIDPSVEALKARWSAIRIDLLDYKQRWSHMDHLWAPEREWEERTALIMEHHRKFRNEYESRFKLKVLAVLRRMDELGVSIKHGSNQLMRISESELGHQSGEPTNPMMLTAVIDLIDSSLMIAK